MQHLIHTIRQVVAVLLPPTGRHRAPAAGEATTGRPRAPKAPQATAAPTRHEPRRRAPEPVVISPYAADDGPLASDYAPLVRRYVVEHEKRRRLQAARANERRRRRRALFITSAYVDTRLVGAGVGAR